MAPINTTIDDLQIHLPQWVSELPLYQLIEEANIYIGISSLAYIGKFPHNFESTGQKLEIFSSKSSKQDEKDKLLINTRLQKTILALRKNIKLQTFLQTLKSMDIWLRHVRKVVGTHSFDPATYPNIIRLVLATLSLQHTHTL